MRTLKYLCLFALTLLGRAEDFYVAQTAQGSGSGVDAANANAVAFFNTSGNWGAGAAKISAGDTVHLVGTISTTLTVQGSGSSGSPITIVFEPGAKMSKASWTVVYNGDMTTTAITATNKDYIVVDGGTNGIIECTDNGDGGSGKSAFHQAGGMYITGCNHWEIKKLTTQNIYIHTYNRNNETGVGPYSTWGLLANNCSYLEFHDNIVNNAYEAIYVRPNSATAYSTINIHHNTFSACSTAVIVAFGTNGVSLDTVNIYANDIDMGLNWFETPDANHIDGIHCWTSNYGDLTNLRIYANYIHGDCSTNCTGYIFLEGNMTSPEVSNNVLVATTHKPAEAFIDLSTQQGTKKVWHNTIVGLGTSSAGGIGVVAYGGAGTTIDLRNNIFKNLYLAQADNSADTWSSDYNVFTSVGNVGYDGSFKASLASWQTAKSGDSHSTISTPNISGPYQIPIATSSAIGAGVSVGLTTDISGATRTGVDIGAVDDQTTIWTAGAGGSGGSIPTAPSGLSASTISSTQINLSWTDNSSNETGFELERSADGVSGWANINSPAANATTYSNTGLTASTLYYYRVRAVNASGNSSYSASASATTNASGSPTTTRVPPAIRALNGSF